VQSADGSLVVGDSHHYAETLDPLASRHVEQLILDELHEVLAIPAPRITERWIGTYASAPGRLMLVDRPDDRIRIVVVTSGTGASTAFAIAEETVAELFGVTAC
jgi:glycine/D-amino acid oxidase-like deaminating enzyme